MKKKNQKKKNASRAIRREQKKKVIFSIASGVLLAGCAAGAVLFRDNVTWIPFTMGAVLALFGLLNALWRVVNRGVLPVLAVLCAALAVVGQFNYVTVGGHTYSTLVQTLDASGDQLTDLTGIERCRYLKHIDISGLGLTDVSPLAMLDGLESIDMRGNPVTETQYAAIREALPEAEILWSAPMGQTRLENTSASIALTAEGYVTLDTLLRQLGYFEQLETLDLTQVDAITGEDIDQLESAYPNVWMIWSAPAGSGRFSTDSTELVLENFDGAETLMSQLTRFRRLETLDIRNCDTNYADVRALATGLSDVQVSWKIEYSGITVSSDDTALELYGVEITDITEMAALMECIPGLETVNLKGTGIGNRDIFALLSQFPQVEFAYELELFGVTISSEETQVSLASVEVTDAEVLSEGIDHLPNLQYMDLGLCQLPSWQLKQIREAHEDVELVWSINVCGFVFRTDAEEMDFNGNIIADLSVLDNALEYMPNVTKIDLCNCGHSDEALARFQSNHPGVKVVWMVDLGRWKVRTDATAFSTLDTTTNKLRMNSVSFMPLQYCTELRALDLGHQKIDDLSFLENLTELRILILADNQIRDISVLKNLTKLEYVELFMNVLSDISPLASCPNLLDLNLCYNYIQDVTPIAKLPRLERLWMSGNGLSANTQTYLRNALPGCKCNFTVDSSTGEGWREHTRYDTLFDIFNETKEYRQWD